MRHPAIPLLLALVGCAGAPPGSDDGAGEDAPPAVDPGPAPEPEARAPVLRRLTSSQYDHVLRDLWGEDLFVPPVPEPDVRLGGLVRVGASSVAISPRGVERFEQASYVLAEQAVAADRRGAWMPCEPAGAVDEPCTREALASVGRRLWRRPLTPEELDALVAVSVGAEEVLAAEEGVEAPFWEGLAFGLAGLLQSPDFLMRPEFGTVGEDGVRRFTGYELATRLSFFLWDSAPDEALLDAAGEGVLDTPEGLAAEVERMLADPRARRGLRAFADDLMHLDELLKAPKDASTFTVLRDGLLASMREETLRSFEDMAFDAQGDARDLLTTRRTFLDRDLAMLYGVRAPARDGFGATDLPEDDTRRGLLGQASFLALWAHPATSSATLRGKFVRSTLLCGSVAPPPANVDTSIPEPSAEAPTLRDRIAEHLENPACNACHSVMDPIGLALENFDGIGQWRDTEGGARIDATSDLDGTPIDGLTGLAEAVRSHEDFVPCLVQQTARVAFGRGFEENEQEALDWLVARFAFDEHRLASLWRELVLSPHFRTVGEVEP
jgi:hypothetical protein